MVLSLVSAVTAGAVGLVVYERLQGRPMKLSVTGLPRSPAKADCPTSEAKRTTAPK